MKKKDDELAQAKRERNKRITKTQACALKEVSDTFDWVQRGVILCIQVAHGSLDISNILLSKLCDVMVDFDMLNPSGPS